MLGIEHKAHSFPKQLSTGEQQRVAVARALINQPSLLLIDEPTANLDEANAVKVVERLVTVADNIRAALLIVTHDAVVAQSFRDHLHIEDYVTITTTS
jgi:ABC-type lipoprotein export system ATPase subunit